MSESPTSPAQPLRLHIGGVEPKEGWKILNIQSGPGVDFVGSCDDLRQFADGSVEEVYASHIFEHLGYFEELPRTFFEVSRVLRVGGQLRVAVPDMEALMKLLANPRVDVPNRFHVLRMIYGGQSDPFDFHKAGYTLDLLAFMLSAYCFGNIRRVASFGLFKDCSELKMLGVPISLNVSAVRVMGAPPGRAPWVPRDYRSADGRTVAQ